MLGLVATSGRARRFLGGRGDFWEGEAPAEPSLVNQNASILQGRLGRSLALPERIAIPRVFQIFKCSLVIAWAI